MFDQVAPAARQLTLMSQLHGKSLFYHVYSPWCLNDCLFTNSMGQVVTALKEDTNVDGLRSDFYTLGLLSSSHPPKVTIEMYVISPISQFVGIHCLSCELFVALDGDILVSFLFWSFSWLLVIIAINLERWFTDHFFFYSPRILKRSDSTRGKHVTFIILLKNIIITHCSNLHSYAFMTWINWLWNHLLEVSTYCFLRVVVTSPKGRMFTIWCIWRWK